MQFSQLEQAINGKVIQLRHDLPVRNLLVDSRKAILEDGSVFFAIKGDRYDGHSFIEELYTHGIRQFVIAKDVPLRSIPQANVIQVANPVEALQRIAKSHRQQFDIPVIGITGSNGKTIVKEWLFQLLSPDYSIAKSPGSYNSQVGVPLSVWRIQPQNQMGIFEAGISKPGEMAALEQVIQPTIGLITNIGPAHDEGFTDLRQKTREKVGLFRGCEKVIFCRDQPIVSEIVHESGLPSFSWSLHGEADVSITAVGKRYSVSAFGNSFELEIPFGDKASVENVFHCVTVLLHLRYHPSVVVDRIKSLSSIPMRMELREGINRCQVIDDSYNNDLMGLRISLDFLLHQKQKKRRGVILSDIHQSGLPDKELVERMAEMITQAQVDFFVGIGHALNQYQSLFPVNSRFFLTTIEFLKLDDHDRHQDEIILIKGARSFQFERIVNRFQRKVHGTVMEIDLDAVVHNLNYFRSRIPDETRIMVMVKAFGYGSGSAEIANVLQYNRIDYLGVAYTDEGVELRTNNIEVPIMVMNPSEESFDQLLRHRLEPEIYSMRILNTLIQHLDNRACTIHVKLDTGMHRLGFDINDLDPLITALKDNPNLEVGSLFSHLAGSDSKDHDEFSMAQARKFERWADQITAELGYRPLYHLLNSSGILRLPALCFDMVRLGIGLYGVDPAGKNTNLLPVATLKTIISQIKKIEKGETIGYGRAGMAQHAMRLATIAIGYADGFSRAFSGGIGEVLINGVRAPVVGNVCMDMTMVDVTGIDAFEGDEAIVFGPQLPIETIARKIGTIPYEILTSTSDRVKRIFVAESI